MKIYSNPNFPRVPRTVREISSSNSKKRISDVGNFLDELTTRNRKAMDGLQDLRRDGGDSQRAVEAHRHKVDATLRPARGQAVHCHRFAGMTGTAIEVPGGHVHFVSGQTKGIHKKNE